MNEPSIEIEDDLTELKRTVGLLKTREQEISAIADNIPGLVNYIDSEGCLRYANKLHEEWFGVHRSEILGKHYSQVFPAAACERIRNAMEALRAGKSVRYEAAHPWARPTARWIFVNYVPDLDDQGKLKGFFILAIDITERKRLEEQLRESENKFRALIEHGSEGIGLVDAQGMRLFESPAAKRILGYSDEEILGQSVLKFVHPDEVERMRELWARCVSEPGASRTVECPLKHKDGSWRWVEATATNMLNVPAVHAIVFNYHDITERKRAEDQIRFQASLLDQVTNGVAASDLDGKIIYWNHHAQVLHGWKAEEVLGRPFQEFLIPPSEIQRTTELMESIKPLSGSEIDLLMRKKDGSCFPAHVNYVVMKNAQGEPIGILGVSTDITERKRMEEALRKNEAKLKQAEQLALIGYWERDVSADHIIWSEGTLRIFGLQSGNNIHSQAQLQEIIYPDDRQIQQHALSEALRGSRLYDVEYRVVRPDDDIRFVHVRDEIVYDDSYKPIRMFGTVQDITERKHAEEQIRQHAARMQVLVEMSRTLAECGLDYRRVLATMAQRTAESIGDACQIVLYSEGRQHAMAAAVQNPDPKVRALIRDKFFRIWQGRLDDPRVQTVLSGQSIYIPIVNEREFRDSIAPELRDLVDTYGVSSLIDVPLKVQGRVIGAVEIVRVRNGAPYTRDDQVLLQDLADRAALTIQNARLFEEVQEAHRRLQTLSNQLLTAQETERRTIARELHDEIGQVLTAVSTGLQGIQHTRVPATRTKRLNETIALVDKTWNRIRALALDLRPSMLDDLGLVAALDWYVKQQAERSGFKPTFIVELPPTRFEPNLETTVFRIAQIALTNVARHAHAKHVAVELRLSAARLELVVRDDGVGFDVPSALDRASRGASMGLLSLQERVRLVHGELAIKSSSGQGTEIRASFPIPGK